MWDGGLDVGAGCVMCGWSILIEAERRRHEMAIFVAPRAAATFLPRRYPIKVRLGFFEVLSCVLTKFSIAGMNVWLLQQAQHVSSLMLKNSQIRSQGSLDNS